MKKKEKTEDAIKTVSEDLVGLIGVNASVAVVDLGDDTFEVNFETPDETGLLIGFRGENIEAMQTVIASIIKNRTGDWYRILVNIGDYRQKQEEKIEALAQQAIDRAIQTGEPQPIYNLNGSQRRVVHMYISKRDDCTSESQGEGDGRYLVITPK